MTAPGYKMIAVDEETHATIKAQAQPLETLTAVMRRLLGLPPIDDGRKRKRGRPRKNKETGK